MTETVNRNWYSPESRRAETEAANVVLKKMKALELKNKATKQQVKEKTPKGERIRYIKPKKYGNP